MEATAFTWGQRPTAPLSAGSRGVSDARMRLVSPSPLFLASSTGRLRRVRAVTIVRRASTCWPGSPTPSATGISDPSRTRGRARAGIDGMLYRHVTGTGIDMLGDHGVVTVTASIAGSLAAIVGVRPGKQLPRIDGSPGAALRLDAVAACLRGRAGTTVGLSFRTTNGRPRDLRLVRVPIRLPVVRTALFGREAFIKLTCFHADAAAMSPRPGRRWRTGPACRVPTLFSTSATMAAAKWRRRWLASSYAATRSPRGAAVCAPTTRPS